MKLFLGLIVVPKILALSILGVLLPVQVRPSLSHLRLGCRGWLISRGLLAGEDAVAM